MSTTRFLSSEIVQSASAPLGRARKWFTGAILLIVALCAAPFASATTGQIKFFGTFASYQQSEVIYAQALVADASGNLYVSGTYNLGFVPVDANRNPIIASQSYIDGTGNNILGMAIDSANNIYRADAGTGKVQKYTYTGNHTFANGNTPTYIGSGWTTPSSVAVDSSGNVYVLDAGTGSIVELSPSGGSYTQTTLTTNNSLKNTTGLSIDSAGNFYVASGPNYGQSPINNGSTPAAVYKITISGGSTTILSIGSGWSSPATTAIDKQGNLWVSDYGNGNIVLLTPSGAGYSQSTFTNIPTLRALTVNQNGQLYGFAYGSSNAVIWAGGSAPHYLGSYPVGSAGALTTVQVTFPATTVVTGYQVLTQGQTGLDITNSGTGTCTATTYTIGQTCTINVAFNPKATGTRTGVVNIVGTGGTILASNYVYGIGVAPQIVYGYSSTKTSLGFSISAYNGLAFDAAGNLYFTQGGLNYAFKLPASGPPGSSFTSLSNPQAIAVDGAGNLFISDTGNTRVVEEPWNGTSYGTQVVISSSVGGNYGVAVDVYGNLYVSERNNNAVQEFPWNGSSGYGAPVTLPFTGLVQPTSIAVDLAGDVFVLNTGNSVVELSFLGVQTTIPLSSSTTALALDNNQNIYLGTPNGQIQFIPWNGSSYGSVSTIASGYSGINGIATDASGNLYTGDSGGSLYKLTVASTPSLTFATPTPVGSADSADDPQSFKISNIGNAPLVISVPASGSNPSIATGFAFDGGSTCPDVLSSGSAGSIGQGATCTYKVDFIPNAVGPFAGNLVLTDNNLAVTPSTQTIPLSGTGIVSVTKLAFGTAPATPIGAGGNAGSAVTVKEENSSSAVVTTATDVITITVTGPNSYTATYTATAVAGVATFNLGSVPLTTTGTYTYTATLTNVTSAVATEAVADFAITAVTSPVTILPGGTATYTVTLTPVGSSTYPAVITLTQTGAPSSATVIFTPSATTAGAGVSTSTLTIAVPNSILSQKTQSAKQNTNPWQKFAPISLALLLLPFLGKARRKLGAAARIAILTIVGFAVVAGMTGCGNNPSGYFGQQPSTYIITVTGTSGSLSHSTNVSLTVE